MILTIESSFALYCYLRRHIMIYRIDLQHFLTHAVDHFTKDELTHCEYAIISAKIKCGPKVLNARKINSLYPSVSVVETYAEYGDKKMIEKMYLSELEDKSKETEKIRKSITNAIYRTFVNPLINHVDTVILCDECENYYIDILCKVLKKNFSIEVIDLNQLFTKGYVGKIYIDRDEIWDRAVDIRKDALLEEFKSLESTRDGREKIVKMMNKKQKLAKLKELGYKVSHLTSNKEINKMLSDAYINDNDDEEDE